ncbi:AI-2E family transporter [Teichococcus oryzae]|uniref:AI-2E family transporter n=1 Tax=Teichococcus oryzae TaxID=1608942 RepID=A0A5B2THM5_9PROT|nr:AI-2E family transporter [Pseudoroseomonas oryzae]KAA2213280.1 AI-2E family transporter [Pseudoroseomonas oryzae]
MTRRTVSLLVFAALLLLLLWLVPQVPLLVFAAALLGVFLHGGSQLLRRVLPVSNGAGVLLVVLLLLLLGAAFGLLAARPMADQFSELWRQVPEAARRLTARLENYSWGQQILESLRPGNLSLPQGGGAGAVSALNVTFGALGNFVLVIFLGLYFAIDPQLYRRGIEAMLAPSLRPKARRIAEEAAETLRGWLGAQMISMAVVGVMTGIGLWLVGVPLAPVLGVLSAVLAFIPTIGPVMAAVPGVLLGLAGGFSGAVAVIAVYLAVQSVESYLITPFVQKRSVDLPEAATIISLVAFGLLYGFLGMLLATPMAALLLMLVRRLYVEDYLDREPLPERLTPPG